MQDPRQTPSPVSDERILSKVQGGDAPRSQDDSSGDQSDATATPKPLPPIQVWPVIHLDTEEMAFTKADIAFRNGCQGILLISMLGEDDAVKLFAVQLKKRYPSKMIGVNFLRSPADVALRMSLSLGLDATWTDASGVHSEHVSEVAKRVQAILKENPTHLFFGSIAFKYQRPDQDAPKAAVLAASLGMIATTSGPRTGAPAALSKLKAIRSALGHAPLGIASGVTPANARDLRGLVTHILVATGISNQVDEFEEGKLRLLIKVVS